MPALCSEELHVSCTGLDSRIMDSGERSAQRGAGTQKRFVWYSTLVCAKVKAALEDRKMGKEVGKKKKKKLFVSHERTFVY